VRKKPGEESDRSKKRAKKHHVVYATTQKIKKNPGGPKEDLTGGTKKSSKPGETTEKGRDSTYRETGSIKEEVAGTRIENGKK